MVADRIERQVFIQADLERVWWLVSKAGFFIGDALHFEYDAAEGETVVVDAGQYGRFPVRVERLDPPRHVAYRCWEGERPDGALTEDGSTLVEFTLREQDGGVLVMLVESGFAALPGDVSTQEQRREENVEGWAMQLGRLQGVAEGADR